MLIAYNDQIGQCRPILKTSKVDNKIVARLCCNKMQHNSNIISNKYSPGGSPGLVVMGGDLITEGRGFESQCRILDECE